jgi:hypothetical protein
MAYPRRGKLTTVRLFGHRYPSSPSVFSVEVEISSITEFGFSRETTFPRKKEGYVVSGHSRIPCLMVCISQLRKRNWTYRTQVEKDNVRYIVQKIKTP